jgi:cell division transport system ATP-binding protein
MIKFERVSKDYPTSGRVLHEVDLFIEPKEFISIVGQSGAGKTTLLKLLLAEERPTEGEVYVEDTNVHGLNRREINNFSTPHWERLSGLSLTSKQNRF